MLVLTNAWIQKVINNEVDATPAKGLLDAMTVKLFKSNAAITKDTKLADLTECDFDGYAASAAIVWNAAGTNTSGKADVMGDMKYFAYSGDGSVPNMVYGYGLVDSDGVLAGAEMWDAPRTMGADGDQFGIVPILTPQNDSKSGGVVVS